MSGGQLVVLFQDECHLLWGDLCGYVWGKTSERIEVPMINERQKQTYYGALNVCTHEFFLKAFEKGREILTRRLHFWKPCLLSIPLLVLP